jgi:hypothetical protein
MVIQFELRRLGQPLERWPVILPQRLNELSSVIESRSNIEMDAFAGDGYDGIRLRERFEDIRRLRDEFASIGMANVIQIDLHDGRLRGVMREEHPQLEVLIRRIVRERPLIINLRSELAPFVSLLERGFRSLSRILSPTNRVTMVGLPWRSRSFTANVIECPNDPYLQLPHPGWVSLFIRDGLDRWRIALAALRLPSGFRLGFGAIVLGVLLRLLSS